MFDSVNDPSRPTAADGQSRVSPSGVTLPARWRPVRLLGRGGQAEVWLAEDTELGEMVAVKVFRDSLSDVGRERLRREVRVGRALQHPGLVRVYELIEAGDRPAVVLELVRGGSVADRLREGPLPVAEVVVLAMRVLEALDHLHGHRVVHRDLKPSNLLLDGLGGVKVTDFGLIRMVESGRDLTRTATTVGTPTYMSPEQVRGQEPGVGSDLYSLGVTLYEMLSGRPPFAGSSEFDVATRHLTEVPRHVRAVRPDCPPWLSRFVMTLLEKEPADRFGSAAKALEALQAARTPLSRRVRRLLVRLAAGAVLVALGSVAGAAAVAHWRAGTAVRVEARGREVVGLDERGRRAWRVGLQQEVFETVEVDLTGDGIPETVVSAAAETSSVKLREIEEVQGEVLVVTRRGRVLTHARPEDLLRPWPFDYPRGMRCFLHPLADAFPDQRPLVVRCLHLEFLPSMLAVYWPASGQWTVSLVHHGWVRDVTAVSGGELPRVVVAGVNNRLGATAVAAMLELLPPALARSEGFIEGLDGPGFAPGASRLLWYTALDPSRGYPSAITVSPGDELTLAGQSDSPWRLDMLGNPVDGPNRGLDLGRQRVAFLNRLGTFFPAFLPGKNDDLENISEQIRDSFSQVLAEPVNGALLDLALARALASLGRGEEGRTRLRDRAAHLRFPELLLQLAHLEALAGNFHEANQVVEIPATGFGRWFDHFHLQIRLAVETRNEERLAVLLGRVMEGYEFGDVKEQRAAGMRTRANLWWDRLSAADAQVLSSGHEPAGAALACLARWRLGVTAVEDPVAMAAGASLNPDARLEFQIARAAALLALGRSSEALALLNTAAASLEIQARHDFVASQLLQLARAVLVRGLLESGQSAQALGAAKRFRPSMTDGLLPAILVDEILAERQAVL